MRQINLLPSELKPSKQFGIAVKKMEKFFIGILLLYLLVVGAAIGARSFLNKNLQEVKSQKTILSNELKSLTNVETSSVYIKDRVNKYKLIGPRDMEKVNLDHFDKAYSYFPADSTVSNITISKNNISYSVTVSSISSLFQILDKFRNTDLYKDVTVGSIAYHNEKGYSFNLDMAF